MSIENSECARYDESCSRKISCRDRIDNRHSRYRTDADEETTNNRQQKIIKIYWNSSVDYRRSGVSIQVTKYINLSNKQWDIQSK